MIGMLAPKISGMQSSLQHTLHFSRFNDRSQNGVILSKLMWLYWITIFRTFFFEKEYYSTDFLDTNYQTLTLCWKGRLEPHFAVQVLLVKLSVVTEEGRASLFSSRGARGKQCSSLSLPALVEFNFVFLPLESPQRASPLSMWGGCRIPRAPNGTGLIRFFPERL